MRDEKICVYYLFFCTTRIKESKSKTKQNKQMTNYEKRTRKGVGRKDKGSALKCTVFFERVGSDSRFVTGVVNSVVVMVC
jgi:hypothetical protein